MKLNSLALSTLLVAGLSVQIQSQSNQTSNQALTSNERDGLILMRQEEKLALDIYAVFSQQWGGRPFSNIVRAEQMHMDAVGNLLKTYGLNDPNKGLKPGEFSDPKLKKLYSEMIAAGKKSRVGALKIGAEIEDLDLYDLGKLSKETSRPDILGVYNMLIGGSKNHMRAFVNNLQRSGDSYQAKYISQTELELILQGQNEHMAEETLLGSSTVYRARVDLPIERVAAFIEDESKLAGFRATGKHDLQLSLAKEKLEVTPTLIVELCQPDVAYNALKTLPEFSTAMPCRLSLIERNGMTDIMMLQPTALAKLISDTPDAQKLAEGVQRDLVTILSKASKRKATLDQAWFDVNLPYKSALFSSNSGAPGVAKSALKRTIAQWNQIKRKFTNSEIEHTKSQAWAQMTVAVTDHLAKSEAFLERGESANAHESLESVRELWAHYRKGFDGLNFTDSLFYFHEEMEAAIVLAKSSAKSEEMSDQITELRELWKVVEKSTLPSLSLDATDLRQRLLSDLSQTLQKLNPESPAAPELLTQVKRQFVALYMQFG